MITDERMDADMPKLTRDFSKSIEFLLPLRHSARFYDEDGGVVPESSRSSETDVNGSSSGEMYAMTIQTLICGHDPEASCSNGTVAVCEPVYARLSAD